MNPVISTFKHASVLTALALTLFGHAVLAQPTFGNPSPTAGSSTSNKANAAADAAA